MATIRITNAIAGCSYYGVDINKGTIENSPDSEYIQNGGVSYFLAYITPPPEAIGVYEGTILESNSNTTNQDSVRNFNIEFQPNTSSQYMSASITPNSDCLIDSSSIVSGISIFDALSITSNIDFGTVLINSVNSQYLNIENNGANRILLNDIDSNNTQVEASLSNTNLNPKFFKNSTLYFDAQGNICDSNGQYYVEDLGHGSFGTTNSENILTVHVETLILPFKATITNHPVFGITVLPLVEGYTYNFDVDWGDGSPISHISSWNDVNISHIYADSNQYQISVTGDMPYWNYSSGFNSMIAATLISLDDAGSVGFGQGITTFAGMFSNCVNLTSVALFDTSSGTNFDNMFSGCTALTSVPLFDTSSGTTFNNMFLDDLALTSIPLFNFSNGTSFDSTFSAIGATTVPLFNLSSATNLLGMFAGAPNLTSVPLFNVSSCEDFSFMFSNCTSLVSVPAFSTLNATNFNNMFQNCTALTTVPNYNCASGLFLLEMFSGCTNLTTATMSNVHASIGYQGCTSLSISERNSIYTALGAGTGNTIYMPTAIGEDDSIATAKGWTVVHG